MVDASSYVCQLGPKSTYVQTSSLTYAPASGMHAAGLSYVTLPRECTVETRNIPDRTCRAFPPTLTSMPLPPCLIQSANASRYGMLCISWIKTRRASISSPLTNHAPLETKLVGDTRQSWLEVYALRTALNTSVKLLVIDVLVRNVSTLAAILSISFGSAPNRKVFETYFGTF